MKISTVWTVHLILLKTAPEHVVLKHKKIQGQLMRRKVKFGRIHGYFIAFLLAKRFPSLSFKRMAVMTHLEKAVLDSSQDYFLKPLTNNL